MAVITGGVSGIGLGTVELFIGEGARVVAADIQDEKGRMLERRFGDKLRYVRCDVTQDADIAAAVGLAASEFGGLDILFNNAGISDGMRAIAEIDAEKWSWIFDVLVRGPALGHEVRRAADGRARRRIDHQHRLPSPGCRPAGVRSPIPAPRPR